MWMFFATKAQLVEKKLSSSDPRYPLNSTSTCGYVTPGHPKKGNTRSFQPKVHPTSLAPPKRHLR